jgi:hypothetical protein
VEIRSGFPNRTLNAYERLWTEVDDRVLKVGLEGGRSIREVAASLRRSVAEVEKRMRDTGLSVAS